MPNKTSSTNRRGSFKIAFCAERKILAFQWLDSRLVNFISSYPDFRITTIERRDGSMKREYPCPSALVHYQTNMGGVDRGDQIRSHFGGFASQSHFKKWYKKTLMAVLDCMLLNAHRLWNMSADNVRNTNRKKLERYEFLQFVAQELLEYETKSMVSPPATPGSPSRRSPRLLRHHDIVEAEGDKRCLVCGLEQTQYLREAKKLRLNDRSTKVQLQQANKGVRRKVAMCQQCGVCAHNFIMMHDRKFIHALFPNNMTCMDIFHSATGKEIWKIGEGRRKVVVNYQHEIVKQVRQSVADALQYQE
jgi:Transposase IS4